MADMQKLIDELECEWCGRPNGGDRLTCEGCGAPMVEREPLRSYAFSGRLVMPITPTSTAAIPYDHLVLEDGKVTPMIRYRPGWCGY